MDSFPRRAAIFELKIPKTMCRNKAKTTDMNIIADVSSDLTTDLTASIENFASNMAMIFGSCLFVLLNYIAQRFYAFREKKQ